MSKNFFNKNSSATDSAESDREIKQTSSQTGNQSITAGQSDDQLAVLKKQAEDYLAGWKRAQADYANLKKETERQQISLAKFANAELILELLPVLDYFDQALKTVPENQINEPWLRGIGHIQDKLVQVLSSHGLTKIISIGQPFDPNYHEAIQEVEVKDSPAGQVAEEVRPGYLLYDKVLQPAQVKVTK